MALNSAWYQDNAIFAKVVWASENGVRLQELFRSCVQSSFQNKLQKY